MFKIIFRIILIILCAVMIISLSIITQADPDNNTHEWYDSHWGGDTGEENYTEPSEEETRTSGGGCFSIIVMGSICVPACAIHLKRLSRRPNGK